MKNRRNYYRLLQVQPDAPVEIIRASFRALMLDLRQHPDLGGSSDYAALLIEAYETLTDPRRRAAYDTKLPKGYIRKGNSIKASEIKTSGSELCPFCGHLLSNKALPGDHCPECGIPLKSKEQTAPHLSGRRSLDRMKRNEKVSYWSAWPQKPRDAIMNDLSPHGMGLLCPEQLSPGTILKISGPRLLASAVVTNTREEMNNGRRLCSAGVSFLAVDFEDTRGYFLSTTG